jgi:hypothetical protein
VAVPTLVNIHPRIAHPSGEALVRILGGGFHVPLSGTTYPTVRLTFNGEPSAFVAVVNHALLYARVPASRTGVGPVVVRIENLDAAGLPIAGEMAEASGLFAYQMALLTDPSALLRVTRAFVELLQQQTIPNVSVGNTHTEYDESTGDTYNLTEVQKTPAIVVVGPEIEEVPQPEDPVYVEGFGYMVQQRPPTVVDISFDLTATSDKKIELINLQAMIIEFFRRNRAVVIDRYPATRPLDASPSSSF